MKEKKKVKLLENPSEYKMDHAKRGMALINLNKYDPNPFNLEEKEWSIKDVENLKTLKYLEFDLDFAENLTKTQIGECLKQIASINHDNFDCFLCVVMSHGRICRIFRIVFIITLSFLNQTRQAKH